MPNGGKPTRQEVHATFQALYNALNQAYWVAGPIQDKDRIHGTADLVFDILTQLNREDIESRTEDLTKLKQLVSDTNKRLDKLKADIDQIIHVVQVATELAKAIDKVVEMAGKSFLA